jgi:hypothetical protein
MSIRFFLALCASSVLATIAGLPNASASECKYEPVAQLPINYLGRTLGVKTDGTLNGKPAVLLPDTGSVTLLTRPGVENHGLMQLWKAGRLSGSGGMSQMFRVPVQGLSMGDLKVSGIGLMRMVDESSSRPDFDAVVGADFLLKMDVEIDLPGKQIRLFKPKNCDSAFLAYWDPRALRVPLLYVTPNKLPAIEVKLNGVSLRAMIDTGAYSSSVNASGLAKLGLSVESEGMIAAGSSSGFGNQRFKNRRYRFNSFAVGDHTVAHPEMRADSMENKDFDVLLGNDFMRAYRILLAPSQDMAYLSHLGGQPFFTTGVEDWVQREAEQGNHYAQFRLAMAEKSEVARDQSPWLQQALEAGNPLAQRYRAAILLKAGRTADALPLLEHAIEADQSDMPAQLQLFRARVTLGQTVQAQAGLSAALGSLDESRWPNPIASYYLGKVGLDKLIAEASAVKEQASARRCEAYSYASTLYAAQGDTHGAKELAPKRRSECGVKAAD